MAATATALLYSRHPFRPKTHATPMDDNENHVSSLTAPWSIYIVRCKDGSYYTGITTDLTRRIAEHNSPGDGAKYTRPRRPVTLVYSESAPSRATATQRENQIKKLRVAGKLRLIADNLGPESHQVRSLEYPEKIPKNGPS